MLSPVGYCVKSKSGTQFGLWGWDKLTKMQKGEIQIYKTKNGTEIQVKLDNETIWLDAHLIAKLYDVNRPAIVKHIQNIYKAEELNEKSTCSILEQLAADGKKRK